MSKFKIVNLFDKIFITISTFLIIYAWINFFIRDLYVTFFLSLIFSFAVVFLLFFYLNKKNEKGSLVKNHTKEVEEKFLAFRLLNKNEKIELINQIISKNHKTQVVNNCIFYRDEFCSTHLTIIATEYEKITFHELLNILENSKKDIDNIEIICSSFDPTINTQILKNANIKFTTKKELYDEYFFKNSIFPDCSILNTEKQKFSVKKIAKNFFTPNKSKGYFLCGLVLIFSSIILPYHYYYLIFGTILLTFSIICKLQKNFIC